MSNLILTRQQLRTRLLTHRRALSPIQQSEASLLICQQLKSTLFFMRSKRIAFYYPSQNEVNALYLLEKALSLGKECYLPILHPFKKNSLWFIRYKKGDCLKKNKFGILEPSFRETKKVAPWCLDLVLTPLVGFNKNGYRLGMGGGYYDRTFSFQQKSVRQKPLLIGLGYSFQQIGNLPVKEWDVPLNMAVTEQSIYIFKK